MTYFKSISMSLAMLGCGSLALADGRAPLPPLPPKMEQECSACHIVFRPNKSKSNCQACHVDATRGDLNGHKIRIPR